MYVLEYIDRFSVMCSKAIAVLDVYLVTTNFSQIITVACFDDAYDRLQINKTNNLVSSLGRLLNYLLCIIIIKLKSHQSVHLSICLAVMSIFQPCQHGLIQDLLEIKAESSEHQVPHKQKYWQWFQFGNLAITWRSPN